METSIRKIFYAKCNCKYGGRFTGLSVLCRSATYRLANEFRITDSLLKSDAVVCVVSEALGDDNEGSAELRTWSFGAPLAHEGV
jgi:hypothetical protein